MEETIQQEEEIDLRDLYNVIIRKKDLFLKIFFTVVILSLVYAFTQPKLYNGVVKLLIESKSSQSALLGLQSQLDMGMFGLKDEMISTTVELIKMRPVIDPVIKDLELKSKDGEYLKAAQLFAGGIISVKAIRGTTILEISTVDKSPAKAAALANHLAISFVDRMRKYAKEEAEMTGEFLETQIKIAQDNMLIAEKKIQDFTHREKTVALNQETESNVDKLTDLEVKRKAVLSDMDASKGAEKELRSKIGDPPRTLHPFYREWKEALDQTTLKIATMKAELTSLDEIIEEYQKSLKDLPQKQLELARLTRELKISEEAYSRLLESKKEASLMEAAQIGNVRVVEPAVIPEYPFKPNKKLILLMGMVLGGFLGLGIVFFINYFQDNINEPDDVKKYLKLTVLGTIPWVKNLDKGYQAKERRRAEKEGRPYSEAKENSLYKYQDDTLYKEAYHNLFTNIKIYSKRPEFKKLAVVSATPAEGKSSTISNLALSMVEHNKKVLLIECDIRRARLFKLFNVQRKDGIKGIVDYIYERANKEEIILNTEDANLDVVFSGPYHDKPALIFESNKFKEFVAEACAKYDHVLFDLPPVFIAPESLAIYPQMDTILFVIESDKVSKKVLVDCKQKILEKIDKDQLFGVVLNKMRRQVLSGGYDYSKYYYHYYHKEGQQKPRTWDVILKQEFDKWLKKWPVKKKDSK
ncbi:MAG: polysaccharide biosynthesis tyrosine autokinase [Candidatus Margulisbacteria bacterium]|nr:polysaccharide biosynthesis tyrosine autokinase [Candidatus Margulisiibacteriota bacterium]